VGHKWGRKLLSKLELGFELASFGVGVAAWRSLRGSNNVVWRGGDGVDFVIIPG